MRVQPPTRTVARRLEAGGSLGRILQDAGLAAAEQTRALRAFRDHADPRRLRTGTEVRIVWSADRGAEPERLSAIEIALDRDSTVRLARDASSEWSGSVAVLPTVIDTVFAAGRIERDLWSAVMTDPALQGLPRRDRVSFVDRLDVVFQWRVDFSRRIVVGDTYRFAFERDRRPDGSMRSGQLLAAELVNAGRAHHAIWFDPNEDGRGTWYDLDGESVRRAFLMRPIKFSRISSRYSNSRFHPILKRWRSHRGVDYAAASGTEVEATGDGVIARRGWSDSYGRVIDVSHPNGFLTRYAHMRAFAGGTAVGSRVAQGQVIGYVGMTGLATGPHLHYEMHKGGRPVDPLSIELPADDPIPGDDFERWALEKEARYALLMRLPGPEQLQARRADD